MTQPDHANRLAKPGSASTTQPGEGRRRGIEKLGFFLLLLHRIGANRFWEIDALRGVAIAMMVVYHLAYDLVLLGYHQTSVVTGPWRVFARATATLFVLLVGVSLAISFVRRSRHERGWRLFNTYLVRGLKLLGWGMVITLITWLYMGKVVIIFGILHLIGAVTILAYPFLSLRWSNLPIGVAMIALGMYLNQLQVSHPWLLLLGLRPRWLFQVDYFPLLPWFGVALLGVFVGQSLYPTGARRFDLPEWDGKPGIREFVWLGHHSLAIYLIHQPILFAALSVLGALGILNAR
jgi:uncharacterized membrane protein